MDRTILILKLEKINMKNSAFNCFITYHEHKRHLEEILEYYRLNEKLIKNIENKFQYSTNIHSGTLFLLKYINAFPTYHPYDNNFIMFADVRRISQLKNNVQTKIRKIKY